MMNKIITLLTDFGEKDWFVGAMKGVMASITPGVNMIDMTHLIPPGDIRRGAFSLRCAYRYFPRGTVHLAVVDPGVGSDREILVVEGKEYIFVGPDNGLLSYILADRKDKTAYHVLREELFLDEVSHTFHGRDIFAPLAAHLAGGMPPDQVGPICNEPVTFPLPICDPIDNRQWEIEVVAVDTFGNCILSLPLELLPDTLRITGRTDIEIRARGDTVVLPLVESYTAVEEGTPLAIRGSCGFLEVAVNQGEASRYFGLRAGDKIMILFQ